MSIWIDKSNPHLVPSLVCVPLSIFLRCESDSVQYNLGSTNARSSLWLKAGNNRYLIIFEGILNVLVVNSNISDELLPIQCHSNNHGIRILSRWTQHETLSIIHISDGLCFKD